MVLIPIILSRIIGLINVASQKRFLVSDASSQSSQTFRLISFDLADVLVVAGVLDLDMIKKRKKLVALKINKQFVEN